MYKYPKIESVFNRDPDTHKLIWGDYRLPEFEYLSKCEWIGTEKIHGTGLRVMWDTENLEFRGRSDKAQMPTFLQDKLQELFHPEMFVKSFSHSSVCLYLEGFGARIQKGGGNYIPDGVGVALFDILIKDFWLKREDVLSIASSLGMKEAPADFCVVPIAYSGPLLEAAGFAADGFRSKWGDFNAEGLVLRPAVDIKNRLGKRIITKVKEKDFEAEWRNELTGEDFK